MHRLLTGLLAASALCAFTATAQAECYGNHNVIASAEKKPVTVAMSTEEDGLDQSVATDESGAAGVEVCADGEKDCTDATSSAVKH